MTRRIFVDNFSHKGPSTDLCILYSSSTPEYERSAILGTLTNLFSCDLGSLAPEIFMDSSLEDNQFFSDFCSCLHKNIKDDAMMECVKNSGITHECHLGVSQIKKDECYIKLQHARGINKEDLDHGKVTSDNVTSASYLKYVRCLNSVFENGSRCLKDADMPNKCADKIIRAISTNLQKLASLESTIHANPDMYIIYYARDPRAIAHYWVQPNEPVAKLTKFVRALCQDMSQDLAHLMQLRVKYPGLIHIVKYEDLLTNPGAKLDELFKFFKEVPLQEAKRWFQHSLQIPNMTKTKNAWRARFGHDLTRKIIQDPQCNWLLVTLSYTGYY